MKKHFTVLKTLNTVFFALMVMVNALANILPIGGVGTGQVSDSYPNLFAPAGITFAVWGVIYVLLALFILYQWGVFKGKSGADMDAVERIGPYFIISSAANIAWIFSWHYDIIPLSLALMIVILITLIRAYQKIGAQALSFKERVFVRLPFSVYFGWITVATIANVTTLLVYSGWGGFGIEEPAWTIVALALGLVVGGAVLLRFKDWAYGAVLLWAYFGILFKHLSADGFGGGYPQVIFAAAVCLGLILVLTIVAAMRSKKDRLQ